MFIEVTGWCVEILSRMNPFLAIFQKFAWDSKNVLAVWKFLEHLLECTEYLLVPVFFLH